MDDIDRITIHPYIPHYENLPPESSKLLETKFLEIVTANGIADNEYVSRFVLTAKINIFSKDIVAGPPTRISQKLAITMMIGDLEEDKVFSTLTINAIGIGQSLEKAYVAAFKTINVNNPKIKRFIEEGKSKIIQYYEQHCDEILSESKRLASQQLYEQSLMLVSSVPNVCLDCFNECADISAQIYTEMINVRGEEYLQQAKTIWSQGPSKEAARGATDLLARINYAADCQPQVKALYQEIATKMNEIDQREWEFKMQQYHDQVEQQKREYQDGIEREKRHWEQHVREYNATHERQMAQDSYRAAERRMMIRACRDVAVEYARNQPTTVNYYSIHSTRIYTW